MIKTVIIDDSKDAIDLLMGLLKKHLPQVQLLGYAQDVDTGLSCINNLQPDLVFLDIEINNKTGFDLLKAIPNINFKVIFITAFNKYAIEAFNHNAVHYLLKPVEPVKLIEAVNRFNSEKQSALPNIVALEAQVNKKIALNNEKETRFIRLSEICYVKGEGRYSVFVLDNKKKFMVSKLLIEVEEQVSSKEFFRVSKSYLINLNHVLVVKHIDGGVIEMSDGTRIQIPRRKRNEFTIRITEFLG